MNGVFSNFKYRSKHPKSVCGEVKYDSWGIMRCFLEKGHKGQHRSKFNEIGDYVW